jgi:transposase-like protein
MVQKPGEAGELSEHLLRRNKGGRPAEIDKRDKTRQALEMRREGASLRKIAETIGVAKSNIERWLKDAGDDPSQRVPSAGQFRDKTEPEGETPTTGVLPRLEYRDCPIVPSTKAFGTKDNNISWCERTAVSVTGIQRK